MARRCTCATLLAELEREVLPNLPFGAQVLWLRLAMLMARNLETYRLSCAKPAWLFRHVGMTEPEVETWLPILLEHAMLVAEADGSLTCPALTRASAGRSTSAENGRKGGRPRRGETAEQATARRAQGHLPLPIQGGTAPSSETKRNLDWETASAGARSTSSAQSSRELNSAPVIEVPDDAWKGLGRETVAKLGMDPSRTSLLPVKRWMEAGHTVEHIRAVIEADMARPGFDPVRIRSLAYFDRPIAETEPARDEAQEAPAGRVTGWLAAFEAWEAGDRLGPAPHPHDFRQGAAA